MNRNVSRHSDWTLEDLRDYFGLRFRSRARSHYLDHEPFTPMALSDAQPTQLHETATHPGRVPVHVEGGYPALKRSVVAMLDGIPYVVMRGAVDYLRQFDWEAWRALDAVQARYPLDTAEMIAKRTYCCKSSLYKRLSRALVVISSYVDRELRGSTPADC